jgi:hypothetical protein
MTWRLQQPQTITKLIFGFRISVFRRVEYFILPPSVDQL